jgi:hypothetical protein
MCRRFLLSSTRSSPEVGEATARTVGTTPRLAFNGMARTSASSSTTSAPRSSGRIRQLKRQQADFAPPSAELRNCLADRAHSLVRFEVTLKNARAVRDLAALPAGRLPNLRWIGRDEVGAYVLGTEAAKLKLVELAALDDVEGTDAVALARELGAAAKRSPSGRRGRPLSGTTIAALGSSTSCGAPCRTRTSSIPSGCRHVLLTIAAGSWSE